ncbi:MAG TPA: ABC transporter permease/substrate-binding protein [Vicinamibacterales bacterium]|nr:ABC transporter permease/substrate-binding protein [Vicinamibacterales bacterium]
MNVLEFWRGHSSELALLFRQHLLLVGISTALAVCIGIPVGILAARRPRVGAPIVWFANISQTIPSLAMFGFLLPLPIVGGLGARVAITVLTLYAVLPIVRTTVAGIKSVDPALTETAVALGMTGSQRLWQIELPLALPSIVAGIRVAAVIAVGTATIAAAVGAGGLGEYIFRGLAMVEPTVILAGAIPAALLALTLDGVLTLVERGVRRLLTGTISRTLRFASIGVLVAAAGAAAIALALPREDRAVVRIGSKNFSEQIVLGEMLAQTIEARTGMPVERRLNLGGTFICDRALRAGDIDMYVEYTGTAYAAIFKETPSTDPQHVLETVRRRYAEAGIATLAPLGFENTFAILVRGDDARRLKLRTISDAAAHAAQWSAGFGYEFLQRADGLPGLTAAYGLRFASPSRAMDLSLIYRALSERQVDLIAGDATSGLIEAYDLQMLEDDRRYFPPYDAVVLARSAALLAHPDVQAAVASLGGRVALDDMRRMNHQVDALRRDPSDVVRDFLETLR